MLYHDQVALNYDFMTQGVNNDINFYIKYLKSHPGKVLEIGAGSGRITIPLIKADIDISALDLSSAMLKILRSRLDENQLSIPIYLDNMTTFTLPEKFSTILITFRAFQHIYKPEDQLTTLLNIKKHLIDHGVLIFDVYNPNPKFIVRGNWKYQKLEGISIPGKPGPSALDYKNRYDLSNQICEQIFRLRHGDNSIEKIKLQMRFFYRFEMQYLLEKAGFQIINLFGDFFENPFRSDSSEMIWVVTPK